MTDQTPIAPGGIGAEIADAVDIEQAMLHQAADGPEQAVIKALQQEVRFRWEQRTALSIRLQDLAFALRQSGMDDTSDLYQALHNVAATSEAWMHAGTLNEAAAFHLAALKNQLRTVVAAKDDAYLERNRVVAALASGPWPSGTGKTTIADWSPEWHNCVYIDMPFGQVSWHYHDDHAPLFAHLPPYTGQWDGHTTAQKYERLAVWAARAP